MPKQQIKHPDRQASTGAYSDGILVDGWLYVAGQGPLDLSTGKVLSGTIEEETRNTLQNIGKILAAGGCSFDDVVKSTVHLADIKDFDRYNVVSEDDLKSAVLQIEAGSVSELAGVFGHDLDTVREPDPRIGS